MTSDVDFVVLWVDGNDPLWKSQKKEYSKNPLADDSENRYRDWDLMRYWFRGIEQFAPWVRKIHFVTCGHYPKWLNLNHPKINLVKHKDFIPEEFLPTFNSNVIELHIHKIPDLSDKFVCFNDDMFLTSSLKCQDFFKKGKPCDRALFGIVTPRDLFSYIKINNWSVINKYFNKKIVVKKNFFKFFNPIYGINNLRNLILMLWPGFFGMNDPHLPIAYLKSTFKHVWLKEESLLNQVSTHRFRESSDVSHWLMRYWQILEGKFMPSKCQGKTFTYCANQSNNDLYKAIENKTYKMICINDSDMGIDFEKEKQNLHDSFEKILNQKSEFEIA